MFKKTYPLLLLCGVFASCSNEIDTCTCWEELVTKADNKNISSSCEFILEMSLEDIQAEAGPECVEKITRLLFGDDDIEFDEELDENAMFEQVEKFD
jgi:hypothetical protein